MFHALMGRFQLELFIFIAYFSTVVPLKTNNKLNNIISSKIEQYNKYDRKGVYKLTCCNCNKFYVGKTNKKVNTRFEEHRKDFRYAEGKFKFSEHVLNKRHENNVHNTL